MGLKQLEQTKEKIGNYNFYIRPFAAFKAANLTGELASVLAPLVGALAPLVTDDKDLADVDAGKAAEALTNCTALSGDKLEKLMQKLLLGGHIVVEEDGADEEGMGEPQKLEQDVANEIFCGEVQNMFLLCFYVIRLNFNGFFKKIAGLSGKAGSAGKKTPRKIL